MATIAAETDRAYALRSGEAVVDLWWPYGPGVGRYSFKTTGAETNGGLMQVLIRDSRGAVTPLHVHRDADETFYVISGEITVWVGEERTVAAAGDYVFAPMGVPHAFAVSGEKAEVLVTFSGAGTAGTAGTGMEGFFREVAPPVVEGEPPPAPCEPDPEVFARGMARYGIDLVGPPPSIE